MAGIDGIDEVIKEFLIESYEGLDQTDQDLVVLEKRPDSRDVLANIFRTIHTIKGTAGLLGFNRLVNVTHAGETLLSRLRDGSLKLNREMTTALLSLSDAVRRMLASVDQTDQDGESDYSELITELTRLLEARSVAGQSSSAAKKDGAETETTEDNGSEEPVPDQDAETDLIPPQRSPRGQPPSAAATVVPAAKPQEQADPIDDVNQTVILDEESRPADSTLVTQTLTDSAVRAAAAQKVEGTIRVDVDLLDTLMDLMGELVLARNRILQLASAIDDATFLRTSQHLNLVTSDLQERVMKIRMQPIGNIWSKFPRIVRDLAISCGKQIRIEMQGRDTELDKTLIETIKDPLTHLVRNAVDHGIESPEERIAAGKSAEGRLFLRAYHEGGQVNIEISDDGAGINQQRIKGIALERGLITEAEAEQFSHRDFLQLMFLPGFSTAETVTELSGRGVGLDVVKTNIEHIGGSIDVETGAGVGTTFKIKIPLTLAIVPALIVTCDGDRYAIPQVSLHELVQLRGEQARTGIEMIHNAPVYRLRGSLVPLVYLRKELGLEAKRNALSQEGTKEPASEKPALKGSINIVVLEANGRRFGLVVDQIRDTQEIVSKPLGQQLKGIPVYAGATIMGDGRVSLILDIVGLAKRAKLAVEKQRQLYFEAESQVATPAQQLRSLLLLQVSSGDRLAVPLEQVAQLERFSRSDVERSGNQNVIQYRDEILPLIELANLLPNQPPIDSTPPQFLKGTKGGSDTLQVVIYTHEEHSVGLIVDRILDVVETGLTVRGRPNWEASIGSTVIRNRVTELVDLDRLMRSADPSLFEATAAV